MAARSPFPDSIWRELVAAVACMAIAAWCLPNVRTDAEAEQLPPPANRFVWETAALGRPHLAADWMWLRAVQFVGRPGSDAAGYPGLGAWMLRIVELSPLFEAAYIRTGVLLSTTPGQIDAAADMLARAEENLVSARCRRTEQCTSTRPDAKLSSDNVLAPCSPCEDRVGCAWDIPLWRGFVAYFGQLEPKTAAAHFCEARRRGGPAYLSQMAARLREEVQTCGTLRRNLAVFLENSADGNGRSQDVSSLLTRQHKIRLWVQCEKQNLRQASGAYRLRKGHSPRSIDDLLEEDLISAPFAPPGQCWNLEQEGFALAACADVAEPPKRNEQAAQPNP